MYTQLEQRGMSDPPVNISTLRQMKQDGEPIACLTAYDASYAALVDAARTDLVLVGDSLGMVVQGHDTTVPVTVDDVIYHCRAVARGLRHAFLVADMPFMSYTSPEQALENSVRMMQDGGAMMIKLEGGDGQVSIVEHLARHDIPVCAHVGLKPQSVHKIGGFRVQGREPDAASKLVDSAVRLQDAGADVPRIDAVDARKAKRQGGASQDQGHLLLLALVGHWDSPVSVAPHNGGGRTQLSPGSHFMSQNVGERYRSDAEEADSAGIKAWRESGDPPLCS